MICQTTHVGSLPFLDVDQAIEFTFKFDIPVLFSLPKMGREHFMGFDILSYSKSWEQFNSGCLDNLYFEKEFFKAFEKQGDTAFKVQLIGPVTLQKYFLKDLDYLEVSQKLEEAYTYLVERLSSRGNLIFVLDEPALNEKIDIARLNSFSEKLCYETEAKIGVHCCAKLDLELYDAIALSYRQLDWGLYNPEQIRKNDLFFGGFEKFDHQTWQTLKLESENVIISPSCGLYQHTNPEEIFSRLELIKSILIKK